MLNEILAYYPVNENLATSGQPSEAQFSDIKNNGYSIVINLALPTSDNAIANEDAIVTALGMSYFHIPVSWEQPQLSDLLLFFAVMQSIQHKKIWVHCALNMRVSCFIYLYQKHVLKLSEAQAQFPMTKIWQPTGTWKQLIDEASKHASQNKL